MDNSLFGLPPDLWYPLFAAFMFLAMITLVPRDHIKRLFAYGILFGFIAGWLVTVTGRALNLFQYQQMGPFTFIGSPVLVNMSWTAALVVFLHFLPHRRDALYWLYIAGFSLMSTMIDDVTHRVGVLRYFFWSSYARFPLAFVWFWVAAVFYQKRESAPPDAG
ncbi:MAG TPA: hypothetical protein GXX29_03360 [Firmicutes bacterium]|nr:hypothetical protein [Bacillota bacterium]